MKNVECIFTDLDGTLLNSNHEIPEKTMRILRELCHSGVVIVPVSARMPATISPITDAIGTNLPVIAYNGAFVLDGGNNILESLTIDGQTSLSIYNYVKHSYPDSCICAYYKNDWIVENINDSRIQTEIKAVNYTPREMPIDSYIEKVKKLHKLFIIEKPERVDSIVNEINNNYEGVYACKSSNIFIEITSNKASKGNAVKLFAHKCGISLDKSIAFGDQINDIDMLNSAGVSVAMGNSVHQVKDAADFITETNDNEGIYEFLNRYIGENGIILQ